MANEKPAKAVLNMGVPVTTGMLFMVAYNLVDTFFIGLLHDDYQLAATNLAYPALMVLIALAGIVGNGGASYIARCIGAGKMDEANHTLTIGFELIVLMSLAIAAVGMALIDPIVGILGAKPETFEFTKEYASVLLVGNLAILGNYAFGQLLRSEGSTFYSMVAMVAGTVANMVLDPLFIFTFGMEIKGAAIATVIGNGVGMVICLCYYVRKKTILNPSIAYRKLDRKIISEIMWVGMPHTLEQVFSTIAMIVLNNLAALYNAQTVAAMGISNKIMSFGQYIYQGFAAGCQPLMGYNYGAGNYVRLRKVIMSAIMVTCVIELGVVGVYGIFAPWLVRLFSESTVVVALGARTLRAAMLALPFIVPTAMVRNMYNAIGKPYFALGITMVRQIVLYIPFLVIFNNVWGYGGLIHAQPCEEFVCMFFAFWLAVRSIRRFENESNA